MMSKPQTASDIYTHLQVSGEDRLLQRWLPLHLILQASPLCLQKGKQSYLILFKVVSIHEDHLISGRAMALSSLIQSESPQVGRAESAGTFNVASESVKPRESHIREPRLSKMLLVTTVSISNQVNLKHT